MKTLLPSFLTILAAAATGFAAETIPTIHLERVFTKLSDNPRLAGDPDNKVRPVWMSEAPDGSGRMFIVYQPGFILVTKKGSDGSDAKVFLDIENRHPFLDNEDGLLSIAFHPGFATNKLFYVYYNQRNPANANAKPLNFAYRSVISEMKVSDADADQADTNTERVILEVQQPFTNHKGGELAFGPDGYLYLGLGDGGAADDPYGSGQNTATLLAKILRIDVNSRSKLGRGQGARDLQYGIPSDNPFVHETDYGDRGARREIYAYGLRNPWRYSWDAKTGALWAGDVGQDLWEEVDLIVKGGNYGWNVREGAHHFKPGPEGAKYIEPVMEYGHKPSQQPESMYPDHGIGLSITGGYVYRGKASPGLDGVYIYADYVKGTFWGLRYDYDAQKVTAHGVMLQQPENVCSFAEDSDHELYALMESGKIFKLAGG